MAATGFHTADELNDLLPGTLPGLLGIVIDTHEPGRLTAHLDIRPELLAPNGYLHAATVVGARRHRLRAGHARAAARGRRAASPRSSSRPTTWARRGRAGSRWSPPTSTPGGRRRSGTPS